MVFFVMLTTGNAVLGDSKGNKIISASLFGSNNWVLSTFYRHFDSSSINFQGTSECYTNTICLLVGCFGFNSPLRQYFSQVVSKRGRKRIEKIEESKNVQRTPTRTCCKHNRPLPYYHPNCRTPRHNNCTI